MSMIYHEKFSPLDDFITTWDEIKFLAECHHCGIKKYDEERNRRPMIMRYCKFKSCVQYFCSSCKRWDGGWGRIMCACSMGKSGHNTYHEFPAPSGKKKIATNRKWKAIK